MNALILEQVALDIDGHRLLGPLDVRVDPGQVVSILGPSGAGKSSLLAFACGVLSAAFTPQGRVLVGDDDITALPPERRGLGILFQDALLFPHLSVGGNLAFGLPRSGVSRHERGRIIDDALESFGLAGFAGRDPASLSGGQRIRVSLLRTLLSAPRALLLDEPFAHLDRETRGTVRELVFATARTRRLPTLLVTHDEDDVAAAAGPVIRLGEATAR